LEVSIQTKIPKGIKVSEVGTKSRLLYLVSTEVIPCIF
jgi:hypothetical protein